MEGKRDVEKYGCGIAFNRIKLSFAIEEGKGLPTIKFSNKQ